MLVTRGRVGLGVPVPDPAVGQMSVDQVYHVGHARTLLLASEHCRELGVPLDVRLDGVRAGCNDGAGAVADLCNLLGFLGVSPRKVYWPSESVPEEFEIRKALGARADRFLIDLYRTAAPALGWAAWFCDDLIVHHPSLIIRGQEFVDPLRWMSNKPAGAGMGNYVAAEGELYAAAGRERQVWSVPLITVGGYKIAKSGGNAPHWSCLTAGSPGQARDFLLETARSGRAYEWSWPAWAEWVKG